MVSATTTRVGTVLLTLFVALGALSGGAAAADLADDDDDPFDTDFGLVVDIFGYGFEIDCSGDDGCDGDVLTGDDDGDDGFF